MVLGPSQEIRYTLAMNNPATKQNIPFALFLIVLATLNYAAMGVFAKLALVHTPTNIVLFIRFSILFLCILPFVAPQGLKLIKTTHFSLHLLRAVCAVSAITLTLLSIKFIPLATVILLSSTEPLFVPWVFRFAQGIQIIPKLYWGIGIGLVGIALVLHPTHGYFQAAAFMALGAGMLRAISVSSARTLTKTDSPQTIMFYFFLFGVVFTGLSTLTSWHGIGTWSWDWMLGVGISSFFFQSCLTNALKHAPARIVSPCCYFAVLFTAIADWLIWDQHISLIAISGMSLVILGAVLTVIFFKTASEKQK